MAEENIVKRYWIAYGGLAAVCKSIFFWLAILLTILLYPSWSNGEWWSDTLSIMPNLLGFSLGGFAMWVAIGDEKFKELIAGSDDGLPSPFMEVNATFAHFILLQLLSIVIALVAKAYGTVLPSDHWIVCIAGDYLREFTLVGYGLGYFIFVYALLTAFAAVLALFRISSWYDDMQTMKQDAVKENKDSDTPQ